MRRNTLQNHIRALGSVGRFTYHAGLTVEEAEEPGLAEAVQWSSLHNFQRGDIVVIRGTGEPLEVEQQCGMFLILKSYGKGTCAEFHRVEPPHGRYSYGRIHIFKGHVEPVGGREAWAGHSK